MKGYLNNRSIKLGINKNADAVSLNGKKFSEAMTKVEYDAIDNKDV